MIKTLGYATLFSTALLGSGAFAQLSGAADEQPAPMKQDQAQPGQASKPGAQPDKGKVAEANSGISFVTMQDKAQWRAPKLIGVGVYRPNDKQIGKIDDILMDQYGKAQTVVIGVGGFLGFGKKDVAVPFSAMKWKTEARKVPATDQPPTNPIAPATGQPAGPPPMKETDPAATEASQGYPDEAILGVTLAQLKAAPDFHYAPSPLAELDSRSTTGSAAMRKTTP